MKLRILLLTVFLSLALLSCENRATFEPSDGRLFYRTTAGGDLLITTVPPEPQQAEGVEYPPLVRGFADITGHGLELKQGPWCAAACVPNEFGFIDLRFKAAPRGNRIVIPVLAGEPVAGLASFDIGLDVNVDAEFEPPEEPL